MGTWFSNLFGFIGGFFKKVAKTAIGIAAEEMSETAMSIVKKIDKEPRVGGSEKKSIAFNTIRGKYPNIQTAAINLAIETALAIVREAI